MLDDLKYIHSRDKSDALGVAAKQWQQLQQEYTIPDIPGTFENVIHSGMGGSALWALVSSSWPKFNVPFQEVRDYQLPPYVSDKTLFIASSYSGNTEETLSALRNAEKKGATIVVITSGGKLKDIAQKEGYPLLLLPAIDKPRYGMLYGLKALVSLVDKVGLASEINAAEELEAAENFLHDAIDGWTPDKSQNTNKAKQLALELIGKSVVTYAGALLTPAAHKWKISLNENAKNIAWEYSFPEFNHNEFTGWTSHPTEKPYAVVYLQSTFDHPRVKERFDLSDKLLSGKWPRPLRVQAEGKTPLEQLLWTIAFGDFVSLYTAMLNGVNPIDLGDKDIIERFKKELGEYAD